MKYIILIFSLILTTAFCKAQIGSSNTNGNGKKNEVSISEISINGMPIIGTEEALVLQHLGQPTLTEDYYFEMDEVMAKKHSYNGFLFYAANGFVDSFEMTSENYTFTNHKIKIGDNISVLESIYPLSYASRRQHLLGGSIGLDYNDLDGYATIYFDVSNKITLIVSGVR